MRKLTSWRLIPLACAVVCASAVPAVVLLAAAPKAASKSSAKDEEPKSRRAPRLPAHFAGVVEEEQREKITAVQVQFAPRIQKKRSELKALLDEQEAAIWKLLSREQRKEIEASRAAAKSNRAKTGDAGVATKDKATDKK